MTEPSLDFNRWNEPRRGVNARRWVILSTGLRQLMRLRFFKLLMILAWTAGVLVAVAGFAFTQTLSEDGWLARLAISAGPRPAAVMQAVSALLLLYPDILVSGMFKAIFWAHSHIGLLLSLVALTILVPQLITRDRSSQALTIYLARPLTSRDYLIGKFGIIVGVLLALWTGPLLLGWLLSLLFAPDLVFARYSLGAMSEALAFNGICLVVLASIAFGVSALGKTAASARLWWIGLWILMSIIAGHPNLPDWVRHASFSYDLKLMRDEVFSMDSVLTDAAEIMPMLNADLASEMNQVSTFLGTDNTGGVVTALAIMVIGSSLLFLRRIKPE